MTVLKREFYLHQSDVTFPFNPSHIGSFQFAREGRTFRSSKQEIENEPAMGNGNFANRCNKRFNFVKNYVSWERRKNRFSATCVQTCREPELVKWKQINFTIVVFSYLLRFGTSGENRQSHKTDSNYPNLILLKRFRNSTTSSWRRLKSVFKLHQLGKTQANL
jgi:hypothetical protein